MTTTNQQTLDLNKLDLRKKIVLDLSKRKGLETQKAQICLVIDRSGSMSSLYSNGTVQDTLERLVPVAMQFDDNGEFEVFLFSDDVTKHKNNVTVSNVAGLVKRELNSYPMGGTNYSPAIKAVMDYYLKPESSSGGFFKKIFGSSSKEYSKAPLDVPVYVVFITDGENFDRNETINAITEAAKYGIFFQFIGIGSERFTFLESLDTMRGRYIDNANFFKIKDLNRISDEDLYSYLLNEFPNWVTEARSKQLIK